MHPDKQLVVDIGSIRVSVTRKRVKNVNFRIGTDGQPHMSVPLHMSDAAIKRVALEHRSWFERALTRTRARTSPAPQKWESGEILNVWGTPTRLRLVKIWDANSPCTLMNGELHVFEYGDARQRMEAVEAWLKSRLLEYVEQILPQCERETGLHPTSMSIRRMKTRWGSCTTTTGRIRLNTALAECPQKCTHMVLIHELCHLRVRNHGPQFKALMDLYCPDWRVTQRWLDEHSPSQRTS